VANVDQESEYVLVQARLAMATHPGPDACRCLCGVHMGGFCAIPAETSVAFAARDGKTVQVPMCYLCSEAVTRRVENLREGDAG